MTTKPNNLIETKVSSEIENEVLSQSELTDLSEIFRLLGDPSRLKIILYCMAKPRSVTEISHDLDLSQSLVSHHLRLLRGARLVKGVRHARHIFYEISDHHIETILFDAITHIKEEDSHGGHH